MSPRDRLSYAVTFVGLAGRVRCCSVCERPRAFAGFELAHEEGWRWQLGNRRIVWWCPDCRPAEASPATLPRGDVRALALVALELGIVPRRPPAPARAPRRRDVLALAKVARKLLGAA